MKKFLLISAMSLLAVACGKDDKNPFTNAKEAIEDKDLQGKNFESQCSIEPVDALLTGILSGGQASVKSSRVAYRFEGSNITRTTVLFANLNCDGEAFRYSETGTFNVTKNQRTNDGAYFIDINYKKLELSMTTDVGVVSANAIKLCGIQDWAVSQSREVTAQAKDATCYGTVVPRVNNNVYRLDEGKILMLGTQSLENGSPRPSGLSNQKYTAN
jgi:hypothetical protein